MRINVSTTRHRTHRLFLCLHRLLWLSALLRMAAFWLRSRHVHRFHMVSSFVLVLDLLSWRKLGNEPKEARRLLRESLQPGFYIATSSKKKSRLCISSGHVT